MYNRIILIGRPTRDPELRFTAEGHAVASFTLAVDRPFKNGQGEREADFIDVTVWRKPAESTAQYVHKGHLIAVEGRLDIRSYTDRQGIRRKGARVVASVVRFLTPKSGNEVGDGQKGTAGDEAEGGAPAAEAVTAAADDDVDVPF
jgi:single-strand DNA-binding protein